MCYVLSLTIIQYHSVELTNPTAYFIDGVDLVLNIGIKIKDEKKEKNTSNSIVFIYVITKSTNKSKFKLTMRPIIVNGSA